MATTWYRKNGAWYKTITPPEPDTPSFVTKSSAGDASTIVSAHGTSVLTVTNTPPPSTLPISGVSDSDENHGGTQNWKAVRVYSGNNATTAPTRFTGVQQLGVTITGSIYTSPSTAETAVRNFLNGFYNGTASRANVKVYIANGNEFGDKVLYSNIANFISTCQRMYQVIHEEISPGVRRWPLAYFGLDPTHNQEQQAGRPSPQAIGNPMNVYMDEIFDPLAPYLDFIAWSAYPPGREFSNSTNPRYDYPDPSSPYVLSVGWLHRIVNRTVRTRDLRRAALGPSANLIFNVWETGIGKAGASGSNPPNDPACRPFYAAHIMSRYLIELVQSEGLEFHHNLWWDQEVTEDQSTTPPTSHTSSDSAEGFPRRWDVGNSRNILRDEYAAANPSITQVWQDWTAYVDEYGGHKPASWPTPTNAAVDARNWNDSISASGNNQQNFPY